MEPSTLAAIAALITRWTYGTGMPRLGAPPRIFLLPAPPGWVPVEAAAAAAGARAEMADASEGGEPETATRTPTAARSVFFRKRTAMAQSAAQRKVASGDIGQERGTSDASPGRRADERLEAKPRQTEAPVPERAVTIERTIRAPDPWSIMPSRTLRGVGAHHLPRRFESPDSQETLGERVAREGPDDPTPVATISRWNLLIVPTQPGFRASDQGVKALVLYLDRSQLLRSPTVSTVEEFVGHPWHPPEEYWRRRLLAGDASDVSQIISLNPGVFSHQIFYEGAAPPDGPPIMGAHIGHRTISTEVPFGPEDRKAAFWLALIGCRYAQVSRGFLERLHSILYLRPLVFAVPYTPATGTDGS